jgi:hypothetical protein
MFLGYLDDPWQWEAFMNANYIETADIDGFKMFKLR